MTQRGYPLWLLRDVRTLAAVTLSFCRLMIFLIIGGDDAMRHEAFRIYYRSKAADLLASAEQHLDRALWREAYRRLGWNPRLAPTSDIQPPEDDALLARTKAYRDAFFNMEGVVRAYVDHLCAQYSISQRDLHMARDPLRHACKRTRATSPGYAGGGKLRRSLASLSRYAIGGANAQRWRTRVFAHDGGDLAFIRGPPRAHFRKSQPTHLAGPPARSHPHAQRPSIASACPAASTPVM